MTTSLLSIENLSVSYKENQILHSINWEIQPGEFWGILGPNGSGKSTLLKTIGGWLTPEAGSVKINGKNINEMSRREVATRVSVMLSEETSGPFDVIETILMGRYPHLDQWKNLGKSDQEFAEELLNDVGLSHKKSYQLNQLSQGERQRIWLARALAQETPLLLLDEPTSHLDIKNQGSIFSLLEKLCSNKKLGIILVSHSIDLSLTFNSHLLLLKNGAPIAKGEKSLCLSEEILTSLYDIPMKILKIDDHHSTAYPIYRDKF